MVPSPRYRTWCLHCALIALSIHGMTPDLHDVTSGAIPTVLRSILGDGSPTATDKAVPGDEATDENPDEICTPASVAARNVAIDPVNGVHSSHRMPPSPRATQAGSSLPRPPGPPLTACRRLATLSRFKC